jgi:hypothetical protein
MFSMVMTGEIDLFISGEDVMDRYEEQDWFDDLRKILSESDLALYEAEDRLLYRNSVPVAIRITDSAMLEEYYHYNGKTGEEICAGFTANGAHQETAAAFVRYLLGK